MEEQALHPGTMLHHDSYRIERVLGQGGFGITYLATDVSIDRKVAVKEFFPKNFCDRIKETGSVIPWTKNSEATVEKLKAKFLKEARNIAKFNNDNIIRIITAFEQNDTAYYVMDYIKGETLSEMVKREGPLPERRAIRYIKKIGQALEYLHKRHINHLDVKPANIMVRRSDDEPILIDFGLAKQYGTDGRQTSTTPVGISRGYAPIEQYKDGGVAEFSPRTDLYSLAATFYYLLSGTVPQEANQLINEDMVFPASVPKRFIPAISKAMEPRISNRHETIGRFLDEISGEPMEDERTVFDNDDTTFGTPGGEVVEINNAPERKTVDNEVAPSSNAETAAPKKNKTLVSIILGLAVMIGISAMLWAFIRGDKDNGAEKQQDNETEEVVPYLTALIPIEKDGKWGFIDEKGDIAIPLIYDYVWDFSEGLALVSKDGKFGFIDEQGNTVIPIIHDYASSFADGLAGVRNNGKWGFIDNRNKTVIPFVYNVAFSFSDSLAAVQKDGKWGFIDKQGNTVIPFIYVFTSPFSDGLAKVMKEKDGFIKEGFIDKQGNTAIPFIYDFARGFSDGLAAVEKDGKQGFIDKQGNTAVPFIYEEAMEFSDGLAAVKRDGKWGFIDKEINTVIPFIYDSTNNFSDGLAAVKRDGKWGFIDKEGNIVIPFVYDFALSFRGHRAKVVKNGREFYIDKNGKEID